MLYDTCFTKNTETNHPFPPIFNDIYLQILMSLLLFFCIPSIKFTTNTASQVNPEDDDNFDELEEVPEEESKDIDDTHNLGKKKMPDGDLEQEVFVRAKTKRKKAFKKKLYKVQMFSDIRTNSIGVFSAFYFFYTAPVTVFIANTVSSLARFMFISSLKSPYSSLASDITKYCKKA